MGYISKYDTKVITFLNRKYRKYKVNFEFFDDYMLWLYYKFCKCNTEFYYCKLEKDLWDYSDFQTGTPREKEKMSDNWKKVVKDKYGLYKNDDKYVEYLKKTEWKDWKKKI